MTEGIPRSLPSDIVFVVTVPRGCMNPFPKAFLFELIASMESGTFPEDEDFRWMMKQFGADLDMVNGEQSYKLHPFLREFSLWLQC